MNKADLTVRPIDDTDKTAWDRLAGHPLQSWAWGEFRKKMGLDLVRLGVFQDNNLIDVWQLTFHKISFSPFSVGYFPKGPLPSRLMLNELKRLAKEKRAIFVQLEPNVRAKDTRIQRYKDVVPSHRPLFTKYTFILNLTKSEDELLKSFHPKTRYNIKIAQKHGVIVKKDNSPKAFDGYLRLFAETTGRQQFYSHNLTYQKLMWQELSKAGIARLFTASHQNSILAAWIIFVWKDTVYYPYGTSSRSSRRVMAPNLMLWEIIRWAKIQKLKKLDLWGALGPDPDIHDPWYGFHKFKEGYRPAPVEFIGSYDLVINRQLYRLYYLADSLRWFLLKLKAKLSY